jgi:hypothetical protein
LIGSGQGITRPCPHRDFWPTSRHGYDRACGDFVAVHPSRRHGSRRATGRIWIRQKISVDLRADARVSHRGEANRRYCTHDYALTASEARGEIAGDLAKPINSPASFFTASITASAQKRVPSFRTYPSTRSGQHARRSQERLHTGEVERRKKRTADG